MAEHKVINFEAERAKVRRPGVADLRERRAIAVVREVGEAAREATRDVRAASSGLSRAIAFVVVLPAIALPALMSIGSRLPWYSGSILAAYLPMIVLGLFSAHYWLLPEWRRRLRRKAERLAGLEDTSGLRRDLLR